jgi:hypothetical protein
LIISCIHDVKVDENCIRCDNEALYSHQLSNGCIGLTIFPPEKICSQCHGEIYLFRIIDIDGEYKIMFPGGKR